MKSPFCMKICRECGRLLVAYRGNFYKNKECKYGLRNICIDCNTEYTRNTKERKRAYDKEYGKKNREKITKRVSDWRKQNPHSRFNELEKREKFKSQGNGINKEQWLEMMSFFNWKCAYSGEYIGKNNEFRTIDHVIALNKGGEHEIWNCVPMHRNYNSSKRDEDILEWYIRQDFYSEERLNRIYEWIEYAKNKWGNN